MQDHDRTARTAAALLGFRRERSRYLPAELFHEPAWDLLLELFVADSEGRRLTGRHVSEKMRVPSGVMSRWLVHLSRVDLLVGDGSGNLDDELTLSGQAFDKLERLLMYAREVNAAAI